MLREIKFYAYVTQISANATIVYFANNKPPTPLYMSLFDSEGNHVSKTYFFKY